MSDYLVLRVVTKLLTPFILLFALYVQFHGDFGPGGGFQAGMIFASGFILYALIFGVEKAERILPDGILRAGIAGGVLLYAAVGIVSLLMGGNFLDYSVLRPDSVQGQHIGISVIEFGIGVTVSCVMITVFYTFARWKS